MADGAVRRETLSIEDAAKRLGIGRTYAYQLVQRDEFPAPVIRFGRRVVVPVAGLDRLLGYAVENPQSRDAAK